MPRKVTPDMWLFGAAVVLLSAGVVMVYSASAIVAADRFHDPYFFLKRQVFWAVLGCGALWCALRTDYRRLEKLVLPLLALAIVLLVLVLVPGLGVDRLGRRLGRGGGSYDRVLARIPRARTLVVVYDEEVLHEVPVLAHDQPVGGALT
ncbi:MAG TPA: 5-formyltetrahydrofolate cyclo-ligase, partial [Candidatus Binatia bacterium]|nr:5-formyltetrahydrofolate cyclo-ligase [Candidatus Binatia bacterium]